ncbi:MAG: glutamate racemase [Fusobacterium sp.]|uniref:glutamate racemase n=1 Tax=Fusobacterium sp. TaxID=68766 RepID=UPI0026DAFB0E|nr:glutamate racemase [Fusobacterium sp.]MDO4690951.1 glutamate racemase [Fusobacterium sp.]
MKIAVFDSGIGGLSVLHLALKKFPKENFLYYADSDNVPYGVKTKGEIINLMDRAIEHMLAKGIKAIVIACNTATSAAIQEMRDKYSLPLIGMEPAVKKAIDFYGNKRILVIATPLTVRGKKLQDLITRVDKENLVDLIALPKLVSFAENEIFNDEEVYNYLLKELENFKLEEYSSVVLGCTHFNYFKDSLRKILPQHITLLDGNEGTVNKLFVELSSRELLEDNKEREVEFYYSNRKVNKEGELLRLKRYLKRLDEMLGIK